jgi:Transposase DDE domain
MTPPRRSTAANGTWRWTPAGCCWTSWSPPPAPRTATAAGGCCGAYAPTSRPSGWSGADAGYAGKLVTWAAQVLTLTVQIVRKRQGVHHFEVLPRRWVVERTFSWLGKCRRLAVDYERKPEHHQAWVQWAMVRVMVKRLTQQAPPQPTRTLSLAA